MTSNIGIFVSLYLNYNLTKFYIYGIISESGNQYFIFSFLSRFISSKTHVLISFRCFKWYSFDYGQNVQLSISMIMQYVFKKCLHSVWISNNALYCCVNFEMAYILTIIFFGYGVIIEYFFYIYTISSES